MGGAANGNPGGDGCGNRDGHASRDVVATAPAATAERAARDASQTPQQAPRLPPKPVRLLLRGWWGLIAFVAAAIAGDVLVVPLAQGPDHWADNVAAQFAALLDLFRHYPAQSAFGALVVAALTLWGDFEHRRVREEERQARIAQAQAALGVVVARDVTPEIERVLAAVRRIEAARATVDVTAVAGAANLPFAGTLVGRVDEKRTLKAGLVRGDSIGVFALEGMGGVGKTALASVVVAELAADTGAFPGGAAWIACNGLEGDDGLAELWSSVARELGLSQIAELPDPAARRSALGRALAIRPRTLLALDNVEPGLDADAALTTLYVREHTAVLLTARRRVAPNRLTPIVLPPLPDSEAATLFRQALARNDPARPMPDDLPAIPALVEAVGGLPLAVELLAAYAANQRRPLAVLSAELARDGINAAAFRADPTRVLSGFFDRSYDVLAPRTQRLFAGLALIAGASFPREAALAQAKDGAPDPGEAADPDGDLNLLIYYLLVEPLTGDRLRLHPLLHDYAAARLAALPTATADRLGDTLVAYWLTYARAHPGYDGMDALEAEAPGLMGAVAWAHEHGRHRDVLALAHALSRFWFVRRKMDDARKARPWAVEAAQGLADVGEERWTQHELALVFSLTGRLTEARDGYARALALARQLDDPAAERDEVHELARLDADAGRMAEARAGFERALAFARQIGDQAGERDEVHELALLDFMDGRKELAIDGFEQALQIARQLGDPDAEGVELISLGDTVRARGDIDQGRELIKQALAIFERLGDPYNVGNCHAFLGRVERDAGNREAAIAHYREALRRFEQVESPVAEDVREVLRRLGVEE